MTTDAWLGLCEMPIDVCTEHGFRPFDTICIRDPSSNTSTIVRVVPTKLNEMRLHPFLHEFLCRAATMTTPSSSLPEEDSGYLINALLFQNPVEALSQRACWKFDKVSVKDFEDDAELHVTLIYSDDHAITERDLERALEGRIVKSTSIIAVSTTGGLCILVVDATTNLEPHTAYRISPSVVVRLKRLELNPTIDEMELKSDWEVDSPGYEPLLEELHSLCQTRGYAAPAGVLLTGCAGVGKTRLASCLANRITRQEDGGSVHWISCQDLVLRASWATESDILELVLPKKKASLVVIDDLDVLNTNDSDESDRDHEYMLVRNTLMLALDQLSGTSVLGICQVASKLPSTLVRIDRLEKEIKMEAPTQIQREAILSNLVPHHAKWTDALTGPTAGFVAADLQRMFMDAWTTAQGRCSEDIVWHDLKEAVNRCTPSQLALLDVSRPQFFLNEECKSPLALHMTSWKKFGGYAVVKKRIYRTVVSPWHRHLKANEISAFGLNPPRGVLFHGPSGTGKTFAAGCLASSLGLNVVKVRAADVLDQWLGGSEAAIRSLFRRARGASPCILYFDEIDAIAGDREKEGTESDVSSRILTTLLNEMDGISSSSNNGVLVLACTNRLQDLDAALLRPGRLEEHIELKLPSMDDIGEILESHLSNVPIADEVDLEEFAELFFELNATGADVEGVCRDACSIAIREVNDADSITLTHKALDKALRNWKL